MKDLGLSVEVKKSSLIFLVGLSIFIGFIVGQFTNEVKENNLIKEETYKFVRNLSCFSNNPPNMTYKIIYGTVTEASTEYPPKVKR